MNKITVDKNNLHSYKLKLTALSPIHIGTGEVYEPTNYVIDSGYLYEFDEKLFLQILTQAKKNQFIEIAKIQTNNGNEYFEKIHAFILQNKEEAKKVAFNRVKVSPEFERKYKSDIGKKVQIENTRRNGQQNNSRSIFNKFEIQKTQRELNKASVYLPGSSLKGAISTAYQEFVYKNNGKKELDKSFKDDKVFRNLSISDTLIQKADSQIAFAINKELFEDDDSNISTMIEVNSKGSEYLATLDLKAFLNDDKQEISEKITKEKIIKSCNEHYNIIFEDKENKKINLKPNQFLISIGKHSGARATTIDGLRKISVKLCQIQNKRDEGNDENARLERLYKKSHFESDEIRDLFANASLLNDKEKRNWQTAKHFIENPSEIEKLIQNNQRVTINAILTQETTLWKFSENKNNGDSFGWLLCEFIEGDEYIQLYNEYSQYQNNQMDIIHSSRNKILQNIKKAKTEAKEKALEKQRALEAEQKAKQEALEQEEKALLKMTPFEKKIYELAKNHPNKAETLDIIILTALKNATLEESFRYEALLKIKEEMIKQNKWVEVSKAKKPEKDKKYKKTQEIIKMIQEHTESEDAK